MQHRGVSELSSLTPEEKRKHLIEKQYETLIAFRSRNAITQEQYEEAMLYLKANIDETTGEG